MSYEKVRVVKVEEVVSRDTGEVRHYVIMDRLSQIKVSVRDPALRQAYEGLKGKLVMAPISPGEFNGRHYWKFDGDGMPLAAGS